MIASDFVKTRNFSPLKNVESYLLDYVIVSTLYNCPSSLNDLKNEINYYLDRNEYISDKELELYLNVEFDLYDNEHYVLTDSKKEKYIEFLSLYRNIEKYLNESNDALKLKFHDSISINDWIILSVIISSDVRNLAKIKAKCLYIYSSLPGCKQLYDKFIEELCCVESQDFIFNQINYFSDIPIMPQTKYQKEFLCSLNISKIGELKEIDFTNIIALYIENPTKYLKQLNSLLPENFNQVCSKIHNELLKMKETQQYVFKYRVKSSYDDEYLTLQELGEKLNVTRERVRQVEAKLYRNLSKLNIDNNVINSIFDYYDVDKNGYLSIEIFTKIFIDESIKKYFIIYMDRNINSSIKINLENGVIYNSKIIDINEIMSKLENSIPNVVSLDKYKEYSILERAFVEKKYRMTKKNFYLKKGMSESDTYLALLDDLFPNGYRIASDEDFEYLMSKYQELYSTETPTTKRYIATKLDRSSEYCLCERGTYINYSKCNHISDKLLSKIIEYIKSSKYAVYYSELLNRFRIDLALENINNQFLLKGLLDRNLTEEFHTNRDSITFGNQTSKWDAIVEFMRNQNGVFNLNDISFEFPDVQYTVLQGIISNESNNHGLLILYDKKFIYADKSNVEILKPVLKNRIEKLITSLDSDFITSHKLFANIVLSDDNIFDDISFEVDGFNTYSIVKYLYPDDYFYRRPIISKLDKGAITTIKAIHDYLIELDTFDDEISSKYITKMNLSFKWIYEYQELCNYMSNEFLQIDKKTMIKKESINIDSYLIEKVDKILNDLIERYNELNITDYNAYFIFPNIENLKWNEYMVIGFINSYLNDKYEFYAKEGKYYIRRLNYEL